MALVVPGLLPGAIDANDEAQIYKSVTGPRNEQ